MVDPLCFLIFDKPDCGLPVTQFTTTPQVSYLKYVAVHHSNSMQQISSNLRFFLENILHFFEMCAILFARKGVML